MLRLSLRAKIMICCTGLVALLDLMVVLFVQNHLSNVLRAEYLSKGRNMAANLSVCSGHFVLTEEFVPLLQLVKDLEGSDEDIAYAYVADRKGRVLAHTFAGGFPPDLKDVSGPEAGQRWKRELLDTVEEGLVHDISVPILQGKGGFVHVGISEQRIQRTVSHFTLVLVGIAGFVLLVGAGLAALVSWAVTKPMRSLIEAAQEIRGGKLGQQVITDAKDETGELVESFNQMSNELLKQLEQKQLREQLFQQEKMALIGQIAASVAHELNTPLGTILLRAQLMQEQLKNNGDISDLNVIESEALRCRGIIDSLLGFSRWSEGSTSRINVGSLVRESLSLVKNDMANKGISVGADYSEPEVLIWADSNQIQQVILNLVTNAADAMPDGGHIEIQIHSSGDLAEIRVVDDGIGMDQDVLKKAFEPFFTTKDRGKGTGLGLPICQRIVEEHGGKIDIESEPHHGTTVSVHLPHSGPEVVANG